MVLPMNEAADEMAFDPAILRRLSTVVGTVICREVKSYYAEVFTPGQMYVVSEHSENNGLWLEIIAEDGQNYTVAPCDHENAKFDIVWLEDKNTKILRLKDHDIRELVNTAFETAKLYQGCGCMRDALSRAINGFINGKLHD